MFLTRIFSRDEIMIEIQNKCTTARMSFPEHSGKIDIDFVTEYNGLYYLYEGFSENELKKINCYWPIRNF